MCACFGTATLPTSSVHRHADLMLKGAFDSATYTRFPFLQASKDVLAMAALEVDLSKVDMGQTVTVKWRGKPVFVRRRTEAEIDGARAVELSQLRDPERDEDRAKNPEV